MKPLHHFLTNLRNRLRNHVRNHVHNNVRDNVRDNALNNAQNTAQNTAYDNMLNTVLSKVLNVLPDSPMPAIRSAWARRWGTLTQLARMPVAHLCFERAIEPGNIVATYRLYTKPHPKYKVIQSKSWGAALIDLRQCASRADYLERIKGRNNGAYHAKRARARGYVLAEIDRNDHVDAIHDINTSVDQRQGRPMDEKYLEKQFRFEKLANFHYYGVFSAQGKLVAYATLGCYGNFSAFSQLMGYRNNDGIMHLMVADIVGILIDQGKVRYVMYDTYFGALPGLRQFKTVLGFQPFRAKYSLQ